ncbi:MAG: hypothetical protein HOC71_16920 [Candidatus Latescibacteria bacterium]|jgi:Zn-finger nucleic acid-binding protein|nr:hypothetical protein [Candidatus Latescibacterota bacterium]
MKESIICIHCGKSFSAQMRQCPFCGSEHIKESIKENPVCPRCGIILEHYDYRGNDIDLCPECSGLWLDNREFKKLTSERDVFKDDSLPYEYIKKPLPHEDTYLKCPMCETLMVRRNFRKISGILIDVCRDHGIWLDAGELEQIRCFIANGGLAEHHDKEIFMNREAIESLDTRLNDAEFMQKLLHHWNFKRWMFSR